MFDGLDYRLNSKSRDCFSKTYKPIGGSDLGNDRVLHECTFGFGCWFAEMEYLDTIYLRLWSSYSSIRWVISFLNASVVMPLGYCLYCLTIVSPEQKSEKNSSSNKRHHQHASYVLPLELRVSERAASGVSAA